MNDAAMPPVFDRTTQDVGNIVEFGHVNTRVPDQHLATLFYVAGLGLTRDPYLMVGTDNMWINVGTAQFHLPSGPAQVLGGITGLVIPNLAALRRRLDAVRAMLAGTAFAYAETDHHTGDGGAERVVEATCPWGNRMRVHAPGPHFGEMTLGMPYVELSAPRGTSARIARFYREILDAPATSGTDALGGFARVPLGRSESLVYRETDAEPPPYDGSHIQIALADFSGPHRRLAERGLITEESNAHQYRFTDITDLDTGAVLVTIEHEVRSMRHPMFARILVNRNPTTTNATYATGHEAATWTMAPAAP